MRKILILVFVSVVFLNMSTKLSAHEAELDPRSKVAFQAAFSLNNPPPKWSPGFGGHFGFNYYAYKYFSLGSELGYRTVSNSFIGIPSGLGFLHVASLAIHPKLTFPIEIGSTELRPFVGFPIGIALTVMDNILAIGSFASWSLGMEYLFSRHMGTFIQYDFGLGIRFQGPSLMWVSQVGTIGIIYNL